MVVQSPLSCSRRNDLPKIVRRRASVPAPKEALKNRLAKTGWRRMAVPTHNAAQEVLAGGRDVLNMSLSDLREQITHAIRADKRFKRSAIGVFADTTSKRSTLFYSIVSPNKQRIQDLNITWLSAIGEGCEVPGDDLVASAVTEGVPLDCVAPLNKPMVDLSGKRWSYPYDWVPLGDGGKRRRGSIAIPTPTVVSLPHEDLLPSRMILSASEISWPYPSATADERIIATMMVKVIDELGADELHHLGHDLAALNQAVAQRFLAFALVQTSLGHAVPALLQELLFRSWKDILIGLDGTERLRNQPSTILAALLGIDPLVRVSMLRLIAVTPELWNTFQQPISKMAKTEATLHDFVSTLDLRTDQALVGPVHGLGVNQAFFSDDPEGLFGFLLSQIREQEDPSKRRVALSKLATLIRDCPEGTRKSWGAAAICICGWRAPEIAAEIPSWGIDDKNTKHFEDQLKYFEGVSASTSTGHATKPHLVGLISKKGGVGKTTIALKTAKDCASKGNKVCVVELDFGGPTLSAYVEVPRHFTYVNAVKTSLGASPKGFPRLWTSTTGYVDAWPADPAWEAQVTASAPRGEFSEDMGEQDLLLAKLLDALKDYDVVVFDAPAEIKEVTRALCELLQRERARSTAVLVASLYASSLMPLFEDRFRLFPTTPARLVLNKVRPLDHKLTGSVQALGDYLIMSALKVPMRIFGGLFRSAPLIRTICEAADAHIISVRYSEDVERGSRGPGAEFMDRLDGGTCDFGEPQA